MIYPLSTGSIVVVGNWLTKEEMAEVVAQRGSDLTVDEKAAVISKVSFLNALRDFVADSTITKTE